MQNPNHQNFVLLFKKFQIKDYLTIYNTTHSTVFLSEFVLPLRKRDSRENKETSNKTSKFCGATQFTNYLSSKRMNKTTTF